MKSAIRKKHLKSTRSHLCLSGEGVFLYIAISPHSKGEAGTKEISDMYKEMRARHQKEFNTLPIHAAFGEQQIKQKLTALGLSDDKNAPNYYGPKIVSLGFGTFLLKEDLPLYNAMVTRHEKERQDAIKADATGTGFIREMFVSELYDHEYGLTENALEILAHMGMTPKTLEDNPALKKGFDLACKEVKKGIVLGF